jgi:hypothetical protein
MAYRRGIFIVYVFRPVHSNAEKKADAVFGRHTKQTGCGKGVFKMTAVTQQALDILENLNEKEQNFAFSFLKQLSEIHETEKQERNAAYLAKIRRGIKQCAEGRGIDHDIIEVTDDE